MQNLRPSSVFKIVWQASDPADANTYYPQAVIRKSVDGSVLATLNLASEGSGRYSYSWRVPEDTSGMGVQIDITVTVYEDAGQTIATGNYQRENREYQIYQQQNFGGGGFIDYPGIKKMVKDVIDKAIENLIIPNYSRSIGELGNTLDELQRQLKTIGRAIEQDDQAEVIGKIDEYKKSLDDVSDKLDEIKTAHETLGEQVMTGMENLTTTVGETGDQVTELSDALDSHGQNIQKIPESLGQVAKSVQGLEKAFESVDSVTVRAVEKGLKAQDAPREPVKEPEKKKDFSQVAKFLAS